MFNLSGKIGLPNVRKPGYIKVLSSSSNGTGCREINFPVYLKIEPLRKDTYTLFVYYLLLKALKISFNTCQMLVKKKSGSYSSLRELRLSMYMSYGRYDIRMVRCDAQFNPLNPELNSICYLLALLGAHHFLHVSRIRGKLLTLRRLMSYIYIYIWSTHS